MTIIKAIYESIIIAAVLLASSIIVFIIQLANLILVFKNCLLFHFLTDEIKIIFYFTVLKNQFGNA